MSCVWVWVGGAIRGIFLLVTVFFLLLLGWRERGSFLFPISFGTDRLGVLFRFSQRFEQKHMVTGPWLNCARYFVDAENVFIESGKNLG